MSERFDGGVPPQEGTENKEGEGKFEIPQEAREEEERINGELPENYALKADPTPAGAIIRMSTDEGETFKNYGVVSTEKELVDALKGVNGESAVEHFHKKFPRE